MGASLSSNVSKVVVDAISKVSSELIQNERLTNVTSQIIHVSDVGGNVVIDGNKFFQKVNLNVQALFTALATDGAQQKLATEIAQQAKAITKGINFGQVSGASNVVDALISAGIQIAANLTTDCDARNMQNQEIIVERTAPGATVTVRNVDFTQITDIFENCVSKSVNNNATIQDLSSTFSQAASASSVGVSEWAVALIGALMIGAPVVGGVVGGKYILKYIFPLVIVAGLVMVGMYFYRTREVLKMTGFSTITGTSTCVPATQMAIEGVADTPSKAATLCDKNVNCKAFEFKRYNTNATTGVITNLSAPEVKYFSAIGDKCAPAQDNSKLYKIPKLTSGATAPTATAPGSPEPGQVYVDTVTTKWYQYDNDRKAWVEKPIIIAGRVAGKAVTVVETRTAAEAAGGNGGDYRIFSDPVSRAYWHVYRKDDVDAGVWKHIAQIPGPGPMSVVPSQINMAGVKETERNKWLLYMGLGVSMVGLVGTVYTMMSSKSKEE